MIRQPSIRTAALVLGSCAALALAGCANSRAAAEKRERNALRDTPEVNGRIVEFSFDQQQRNGAVAGRAVYPHHFSPNQAVLNELGRQHVEMIAEGYRHEPAELTVIRGDATPQLYEARVQTVRDRLAAAGVSSDVIAFSDNPPAGSGMSSARAVQTLQPQQMQSESRQRPGVTRQSAPEGR